MVGEKKGGVNGVGVKQQATTFVEKLFFLFFWVCGGLEFYMQRQTEKKKNQIFTTELRAAT